MRFLSPFERTDWLKPTDWFKPTLLIYSNSIRNARPIDIHDPLAREIRQQLLTLPSLNKLI